MAPAPRSNPSEVASNERLTALAGSILLVLILVELVTVPTLHALLSVHVFVGVLLAGPLAVKLGSTGYRFLRYYSGSPAFVQKGPPELGLRILAPLLIATTLLVVGSGIGLVLSGPTHPGPLLFLHGVSTLIWLPLIAIHTFAYFGRLPRLLAADASSDRAARTTGRTGRLGLNLGALASGAIGAALALPAAGPWRNWIETNQRVPAPFVVGVVLAALALLAVTLLRRGRRAT